MAQSNKKDNSMLVTEYIQQLEPAFGEIIKTIRQIILSTDQQIGEEIKWNAPTFYYTGEMKPFNRKEYKRCIIVTNFHKGRILLVFPSGANTDLKVAMLISPNPSNGSFNIQLKDNQI
jgi:hypothetical protein